MAIATIEVARVKRRPWFRPTLIWSMGFVLLVALWLGWFANSARTQRLVYAEIRRSWGRTDYDSHMDNLPAFRYQVKGSGNRWLLQRFWLKNLIKQNLGIDFVENIVAVRVSNPGDAMWTTIENLQALRVLELIVAQSVEDEGLARLKRFKHLERLVIYYAPITDDGLAHLSGMTQLRSLQIIQSPTIGVAGVRHLRTLTHLIRLNLSYSRITNAALPLLGEMTELEELYLVGTAVSDEGLVHLERFGSLKTVDLRATKVTKEGVAKLRQAMPKLKVTYP